MCDFLDMNRHEFELDDLIERIKSNDNRLVALQVPEGLKMQALEMMDAIEEDTSARIILAADPCYGACDLVHDKMQRMGVELVAHMGHSQMNIDSGMQHNSSTSHTMEIRPSTLYCPYSHNITRLQSRGWPRHKLGNRLPLRMHKIGSLMLSGGLLHSLERN